MLQKRKLCLEQMEMIRLSKSLERKYSIVGDPKAGQYLCSQLVCPESIGLVFANIL